MDHTYQNTAVQMKNRTICIFSKIGFFIWSDSQKNPLFNGKKIILIEQIEFEIRLPIQQVSCIRSEKM